MARKRAVSTDISTNSALSRCAQTNLLAPLLFTWLLPHLDDWGRSTGEAAELRLLVVPGLPCTTEQVETALLVLEAEKLLHRYQGSRWLCLAVEPAEFYRYQTYIPQKKRESEGSFFPPPPAPPWEKKDTAVKNKICGENAANLQNALDSPQITATPSPSPSPSPSQSKDKDAHPSKTGVGAAASNSLPQTASRTVRKAPSNGQRSEREVPAAVVVYRQLTRLYPPAFIWPVLDAAVNAYGPAGIERWTKTVEAYLANGWNKANIANMLDFFRRGEMPGVSRASPTTGDNDVSPQAAAFLRLASQSTQKSERNRNGNDNTSQP